jgi:hypothetical protein
MGFFGAIGAGCLIGIAVAIVAGVISTIKGGCGIPGSQKYKNTNNEIDNRVNIKVSKATKSTNEELQQWWDTHH